jgi:hypothetical protein
MELAREMSDTGRKLRTLRQRQLRKRKNEPRGRKEGDAYTGFIRGAKM